ncbi:hypothetical protein ACE6H2_015203 [Prunus campanulata]
MIVIAAIMFAATKGRCSDGCWGAWSNSEEKGDSQGKMSMVGKLATGKRRGFSWLLRGLHQPREVGFSLTHSF